MSTLVVGDVHGCADELRELVEVCAPSRVVLVGDLFTKGPDPRGVWRLVRDRGWESTLGNHEVRMLGVVDGTRPGDVKAAATVRALDEEDPSWCGWVRSMPLFLEVGGWTVVHAGLHPTGELALTTPVMATTMRRWPRESPECPHWHDQYAGPRRVVFGHDAVRGPVRVVRDGRPWLIGLDSGCVYGGALSGYLLEEDRLVQVAAARVYTPYR